MKLMQKKRTGFTLIELLVVIAIIAILIALLLPAVQQAREAARRSTCKNNLKQIGLALHNYHDTHRSFPPSYVDNYPAGTPFLNNDLGWGTFILPYMDQGPLYNNISSSGAMDVDWTTVADMTTGSTAYAKSVLPAFICPSDPMGGVNTKIGSYGKSNYKVVRSVISYPVVARRLRDFTDGASNTLVVGESDTQDHIGSIWVGKNSNSREVMSNANDTYRINGPDVDDVFSSVHVGGCHFVFADGRVRFLSENISGDIYTGLGTYNGGEILGEF